MSKLDPGRMLSFQIPGGRLPIETMEAWMQGEPVWPYEKIIETWGQHFEDTRKQMARMLARRDTEKLLAEIRAEMTEGIERAKERFDVHMLSWELRYEWNARWGMAIPCAELIEALRDAAPIVEVGAGSGYMTQLMRHAGIEVIGSDVGHHEGKLHGFTTGQYDPLQITDTEAKTMVRRHGDRAVFCSWPSNKATWFRQMLRAMRIGQQLIVVAEDEICGTADAWAYIENCFEEKQTFDIPCFTHIHDRAWIYRKVRDVQRRKAPPTPVLSRRRALPRRAAAQKPKRTQKAA